MASERKKKKLVTSDAVEILYQDLVAGKSEMEALLAEEEANLVVAAQIVKLRTAASLTQRELARKIGTTASVICRLENADYDGHSLSTLRRIANALNRRVRISFVPLKQTASSR